MNWHAALLLSVGLDILQSAFGAVPPHSVRAGADRLPLERGITSEALGGEPSGAAPSVARMLRPGPTAPLLRPRSAMLLPGTPPGSAAAITRVEMPADGLAPASPALEPAGGNRRGIPFMAAGGALFLAGAIIGGGAGTIVMVAGAGIGAYGVFLYLR